MSLDEPYASEMGIESKETATWATSPEYRPLPLWRTGLATPFLSKSELASDRSDSPKIMMASDVACAWVLSLTAQLGLNFKTLTRKPPKDLLSDLKAIIRTPNRHACIVGLCYFPLLQLFESSAGLQLREENFKFRQKEKRGDVPDVRIAFGEESWEKFAKGPTLDGCAETGFKYGGIMGIAPVMMIEAFRPEIP